MADRYVNRESLLGDPANDAVPITPSDATDLASPIRSIRIAASGTGGIVRVTTHDKTVRDLPIAAGEQWDVRIRRVWATGTTASGLWGFV